MNSIIAYHLSHLPDRKGDFANAEIVIGSEQEWIEDDSLHEALDILKEKGYIKKFTKTRLIENKISKPTFSKSQAYHYPDEVWEALQEYEEFIRTAEKELLTVTIPYSKPKIEELIEKAKAKNQKEQVTIIYYSHSQGLYRMLNGVHKSYPVSKQRANIIDYITLNGYLPSKEVTGLYKELTDVKHSIDDINKLFKRNLELEEKLIVHRPTGGYQFNTCYKVMKVAD